MQMSFCCDCRLLCLQSPAHVKKLPVLCQQSKHLVRHAAKALNTTRLDNVRILVELRVLPGRPDVMSHLLAGCEQFVPS